MTPVQEAYYGKSKNLENVEKCFAKLNKKLGWDKIEHFNFENEKSNTAYAATALESICKSEFTEIEKNLKKEFGFRTCSIVYYPGIPTNAFTLNVKSIIGRLAIDNRLDYHLPEPQGKKYYDKYHTNDCVIFIAGNMIAAKLTPEEWTALLLHEIGHGFQCTPLCTIGEFLPIIEAFVDPKARKNIFAHLYANGQFNTFITRMLGDSLRDAKNTPTPEKNKQRDAKDFGVAIAIIRLMNSIAMMYHMSKAYLATFDMLKDITKLGHRFIYKLSQAFSPTIFAAKVTIGYSGEVFADSFATAYGYGPATVSLQLKLSRIAEYEVPLNDRDCPIWPIADVLFLVMHLLGSIIDPHPLEITRINNQIDKLEREISSGNLPPPLKKKAQADLVRCRNIYNAYLDDKDGENMLSATFIFNFIMQKGFGGRIELRDYLNRLLNFGNYEA